MSMSVRLFEPSYVPLAKLLQGGWKFAAPMFAADLTAENASENLRRSVSVLSRESRRRRQARSTILSLWL